MNGLEVIEYIIDRFKDRLCQRHIDAFRYVVLEGRSFKEAGNLVCWDKDKTKTISGDRTRQMVCKFCRLLIGYTKRSQYVTDQVLNEVLEKINIRRGTNEIRKAIKDFNDPELTIEKLNSLKKVFTQNYLDKIQDDTNINHYLVPFIKHSIYHDLSVRSQNSLQNFGVQYIGDLLSANEHEVLTAHNFGRLSLEELKAELEKYDLKIGELDKERWQYLKTNHAPQLEKTYEEWYDV